MDYAAIGDINAEEFYGPMLGKGGKDRGQRPKNLYYVKPSTNQSMSDVTD